jgi:hypothetical protein
MPMPINNLEEYDKVVNVSWYTPDKDRKQLTYVSRELLLRPPAYLLGSPAFYPSPKCIPFAALTFATSLTKYIYSPTITFSVPQLLMKPLEM